MIPQTFEGQTWFFVKPDELRAPAGLPVIPVVERIRTHFQFLSWPTMIPQPNSGYVFQQGAFNVKGTLVAITSLTIYSDGFHVHTQSTTADTDIILAELIALLQEMGIRASKPITSFHVSTIVADFSKNLNSLLNAFKTLSSFISDRLDYKAPLHLNTISMLADATKLTKPFDGLNPTLFRIDRRVGVTFDDNRYFSMANASTDKHLEILEYLERTVR